MFVFFFNATATTEIYTLSLHDALPIFVTAAMEDRTATAETELYVTGAPGQTDKTFGTDGVSSALETQLDRKSTRLNSSHSQISYAVFCLKKKKQKMINKKQHQSIRHGS